MDIVNKLKTGQILKVLSYKYNDNCTGYHERLYFVNYSYIYGHNFDGCEPGTFYFIINEGKEHNTMKEYNISSICQICHNKAFYKISIDNVLIDGYFSIEELKYILDMELKREFKTVKGNNIELIGVEKIEDEYYFLIKVNGKQVTDKFTESQLIKMAAS